MCIYIYIFYYSIDQPWEYLMDGIKNIPIRPDRGSTKLSGVLETSPALFLQSVAFKLFEDRTSVPLFATRWFLLILCANREPNFSLSLSCPLSRRSTENNFITLLFLFFFFSPPSNDRRDRSRLIGSRIKSAASRSFIYYRFAIISIRLPEVIWKLWTMLKIIFIQREEGRVKRE